MQKGTKIIATVCCIGILVALIVCIHTSWQMREIEKASSASTTEYVPVATTQAPTLEVVVDVPTPGTIVTSPITVSGKAPGSWFFEATAGLRVLNKDKKVVAQSFVHTEDDWMTTTRATFTGTSSFPVSLKGQSGYIEVAKDNPSGLPENDQSVLVPVLFR
jgi:hypothetical protein